MAEPQVHDTFTPLNVNVALAGQAVFGTTTLTVAGCPAVKVPLGGLKVMPLMPLLDAFQFRIPWSPGLALNFTVQDHPLPEVQSVLALILDGLTFKVGAAQLHAIGTAFADPLNVKVALAGQTLFGIEIVTSAVWPGGSVPRRGIQETQVMPLLVAVQERLLRAFEKLVNVA